MSNPSTTALTLQHLATMKWTALLIGLIAAALCILAAITGTTQFPRAYLYAYLFWLGIAMGSMAIVMIHNLTGGAWGAPIRRAAEAATLTLPFLLILFIPIALQLNHLYPWANSNLHEQLLQHRAGFMNTGFFLARAAAYFVTWIILALLLTRWSRKWTSERNLRAASSLRRLSGGGLVIYLMTVTHLAIDWVMSHDLAFFSTTFGFIFATGQAVSAMAFLIIMFRLIPDPTAPIELPRPLPAEAVPKRPVLVDLGNLLLVMVILWAYIAFFQLLVIWMGNTGEDNSWYLQRGFGQPTPWRAIGAIILIFHFFVPFLALLFRSIKRQPALLAAIAANVFIAHLIEQYWIVAPSGPHRGPIFDLHWIDFITPVAIGGLWLFVFFTLFQRRPLSIAPLPDGRTEPGVSHA